MRTKRKISLTIDDGLLHAIEMAAKELNMAKSHIAQKAFKLWLKRETEKRMAKGYEEMNKEDRELAELAFESQREIVS
jgi:hypothetical protein